MPTAPTGTDNPPIIPINSGFNPPTHAALPGEQEPNPPPPANTTKDNPRKVVSITVDSFELVAREVFAVLRDQGQPAADALLAEIQRLRAS